MKSRRRLEEDTKAGTGIKFFNIRISSYYYYYYYYYTHYVAADSER